MGNEVEFLIEADKIDFAKEMIQKYKKKANLLPVDHVVAQEFKNDTPFK